MFEKRIAYIKLFFHVLAHVWEGDMEHDLTEAWDDKGGVAVIGCVCNKAFWIRADVYDAVMKERERKKIILDSWRH